MFLACRMLSFQVYHLRLSLRTFCGKYVSIFLEISTFEIFVGAAEKNILRRRSDDSDSESQSPRDHIFQTRIFFGFEHEMIQSLKSEFRLVRLDCPGKKEIIQCLRHSDLSDWTFLRVIRSTKKFPWDISAQKGQKSTLSLQSSCQWWSLRSYRAPRQKAKQGSCNGVAPPPCPENRARQTPCSELLVASSTFTRVAIAQLVAPRSHNPKAVSSILTCHMFIVWKKYPSRPGPHSYKNEDMRDGTLPHRARGVAASGGQWVEGFFPP